MNGTVVYQHPNYQFGTLAIRRRESEVNLPDGRKLTIDVLRDGEAHASFESIEKANRWVKRLGLQAILEA